MQRAEKREEEEKRLRKKSRKRKYDGIVNVQRFLAVDSVRRFKGLEAEVRITIVLSLSECHYTKMQCVCLMHHL